jgi:3-oxoacyl-[acyl-carrier-protein] synthase-3
VRHRITAARRFSATILLCSGVIDLSLTVRPRVSVRAKISALGTWTPPRLLTNADLEKMVETSDEWITSRVGIKQRHIVEPGMATSHMAVEAAKLCLAERGVDPAEVEVIIVGTVTPDMLFPATACLVQDRLGAKGAWGFDLSAACSSFVYSLQMGCKLIESGAHKKVLVIGADTMSSIIDYTDRATCVLFGDGAGAVLLEPAAEGELGMIDFHHEIDGSGACALFMPGGGSLHPPSHETIDKRDALRASGGAGGLQVCGAQDGGGVGGGSRKEWRHGRGPWVLHRAPGESADHYRDRGSAGAAGGEGHH